MEPEPSPDAEPAKPDATKAMDEEHREAVRAAIARQMDKEIEHKRHELQEVDLKIERAERLLGLLSNRWIDAEEFRSSVIQQLSVPEAQVTLVMNSHTSSSDSDESGTASPRAFASGPFGSPARRRSEHAAAGNRARDGGRSDAFSPAGKAQTDAKAARLVCPVCKRDRFQNIPAFISHCRVMHQLVFPSSEEAARRCTVTTATAERRPLVRNLAAARVVRPPPPVMSPRRVHPAPLKRKIEEGQHSAFGGKRPRGTTLPAPGTIIRAIIRRTIAVRNSSQFIPIDSRENPDLSHEWKISVSMQEADIAIYVKAVRFFLHESFAPNDEVEVTSSPFQLVRRGWGEFPIKVRVIFKNPKQRPVDIEHDLKLDQLYTGKEEFGGQTLLQVELEQISIVREKLVTRRGYPRPRVDPTQLIEPEKVVYQNAMHCPIVSDDETKRTSVPYACASSAQAFLAWNIGRRKASEWRRAKQLHRLLTTAGKTNWAPGRIAACLRELRLTPYMPPSRDLMRESDDEEGSGAPGASAALEVRPKLVSRPALFCKYCGSPHKKPGEAFEVLQRSCGVRQRVHGLCSHSTFRAARGHWPSSLQHDQKREASSCSRLERTILEVCDSEKQSVSAAVAQVVPDMFLESTLETHGDVCEVLATAAKLFVKELVQAAWEVVEAKKGQERPEEARHKVMVPMHVWLACMQRERLDFLTNAGLAEETG